MTTAEALHLRAHNYHRTALALELLYQSIVNGDTSMAAAETALRALDPPDREWEDLVDGPWREHGSLEVAKRQLCKR